MIVGVLSTPDGPVLAPGTEALGDALPPDRVSAVAAALTVLDATGRPGDIHRIPMLGTAGVPLVVATGLGAAPVTDEAARRAVGAAIATLSSSRRVHVAIEAAPGALAEGALLGAYRFTPYKSGAGKPSLSAVTVAVPDSGRLPSGRRPRRRSVARGSSPMPSRWSVTG